MPNDKTQEPIPDVITLQVTLNMKTNQVMVRGPIHRRALAIKMLTSAIEIIVDQPAIIPHSADGKPTNGTPPPILTS